VGFASQEANQRILLTKYLEMSSSNQPIVVPPMVGANRFTFQEKNGSTHVVFYPQRPGPLRAPPLGGSLLEYSGVEGDFIFSGNDIQRQASPVGTLMTVTLQRTPDAGDLTFSLALPPVKMAGKREQAFDTIAVKTKSFGILPIEGAELIDTAMSLTGVAEEVILPLVE
jgi:hypothetical protein